MPAEQYEPSGVRVDETATFARPVTEDTTEPLLIGKTADPDVTASAVPSRPYASAFTVAQMRARLRDSGLEMIGSVKAVADSVLESENSDQNGSRAQECLETIFRRVTKSADLANRLARRLLDETRIPLMTLEGVGIVLRIIGEGKFGVVYEVFRPEHNDVIAVKVSKRSLEDETKDAKESNVRFVRETGIVKGLAGHPNIVDYKDAGILQQNGQSYRFLGMELLQGRTMQDLLKKEGPPSPERVCHIFRQLAEVLKALEGHNIVHRDIKPENVHLIPGDHVKMMDFGFAISDEFASMRATQSNVTGGGTLLYGAPEQTTKKFHDVTTRADMYSLNATMFHVATGKPPIVADEVLEYFHLIERSKTLPIDFTTVQDPALRKIFERNLVKEPLARMTPAQLLHALGKGAEIAPVANIPGMNGSYRGRLLLAAGLLILVGSGTAYVLSRGGSSGDGKDNTVLKNPGDALNDPKTKDTSPSTKVDPPNIKEQEPIKPAPIFTFSDDGKGAQETRFFPGSKDEVHFPTTAGAFFWTEEGEKRVPAAAIYPLTQEQKKQLGTEAEWMYVLRMKKKDGVPISIFYFGDGYVHVAREDGSAASTFYNEKNPKHTASANKGFALSSKSKTSPLKIFEQAGNDPLLREAMEQCTLSIDTMQFEERGMPPGGKSPDQLLRGRYKFLRDRVPAKKGPDAQQPTKKDQSRTSIPAIEQPLRRAFALAVQPPSRQYDASNFFIASGAGRRATSSRRGRRS